MIQPGHKRTHIDIQKDTIFNYRCHIDIVLAYNHRHKTDSIRLYCHWLTHIHTRTHAHVTMPCHAADWHTYIQSHIPVSVYYKYKSICYRTMAQEKRIHSVLSAFSHSGVFICFVCASLLRFLLRSSLRTLPDTYTYIYASSTEWKIERHRDELNWMLVHCCCSAVDVSLNVFQFKQQHINKREWHWAVFKGCFHLCVFACDTYQRDVYANISEIFFASQSAHPHKTFGLLTDKKPLCYTLAFTYTIKTEPLSH